jgi:flavorubredoxin
MTVRLDASLEQHRAAFAIERKSYRMKALIVYESMFGNTEQIARAIADGLSESLDVQSPR